MNGSPGYPINALWRAYATSFILNLPHTNALIRRLQDDQRLRLICGFHGQLPHRTTFNRFVRHVSNYPVLLEQTLTSLTAKLKELLPGLGNFVAVDSTVVKSHSNPNRTVIRDPEASWTAKNAARGKDGEKEWHWGYKVHAVVDVTYGIPIAQITTTAKRNDSPYLPKVIDHAQETNEWLKPKAVIADRGYDAKSNHVYLMKKAIAPIIHIRKAPKKKSFDDLHSLDGRPICMGDQPMDHIVTNPHKGHLYRCPPEGCHLKDSLKTGVRHCDYDVWEHPATNPRGFSWIPRHTQQWKDLYALRQAIERYFKSTKESRRLDTHCIRGLQGVTAHALMSAITFQATALVHIQAGQKDYMRWMVRKVA